MEAARVGALMGHRVTLVEAADRLGGQLRLAGRSPSRADVAMLIPYYEAALAAAGVEVHLGRRIEPGDLDAFDADVIVVATGASPRRDGFQALLPEQHLAGLDAVPLLTGWDVLSGVVPDGPVLLVDEIGHYESFDVAETLVNHGLTVHHVTRFHSLGATISLPYDYAAGPHLEALFKGDYHLHTRSLVVEVGPGRATVVPAEARHRLRSIEVGSFVFMSGHVPDMTLPEAVDGRDSVRVIGDALAPRFLEAAIAEGAEALRTFEPGWKRPQWVRYLAGSSV
jgi:NADPH-dependent 2,4-dienoyl-CoA reductase/sulfur reductase-like enzyme